MTNSIGSISTVLSSVAVAGSLLVASGCVATRDWVREQMEPVTGRVTKSEARINEAESQIGGLGGRMTGAEGKLGQFEGRLGQVDAKTEQALKSLANLKLQRRLVIDMKEGANFAFNSAKLPDQARKEIDGFLSDLKGDAAGTEGTVFLVAGHTDNVGTEDYNFALGQRRAETVSRYLIAEKKVDPLHVVTVSYGKSAPTVENNNAQGRAKNRRVEILVYREAISSLAQAPAASGEKAESKSPDEQASLR